MAFISPSDADQVRAYFADNLQDPVTIRAFTEQKSLLTVPGRHECEYCEETVQLLQEVVDLSDKLSLEVFDLRSAPQAGDAYGIQPSMVPAFVLEGHNQGSVRNFGIPAGYEFSTLIQDLVDVSKGSTTLTQATRDELAQLAEDVHIRVFVTPT